MKIWEWIKGWFLPRSIETPEGMVVMICKAARVPREKVLEVLPTVRCGNHARLKQEIRGALLALGGWEAVYRFRQLELKNIESAARRLGEK